MSTTYTALACSPGVAVGPAWQPRRPGPVSPAAGPAGATGAGPAQVRAAFAATAGRLERLAATHRRDGAPVHADILEAEALIAGDPAYLADVLRVQAETGADARAALAAVTERHAAVMAALTGDLRERAADIREVGRLVDDELTGRRPPAAPDGPLVLLADEATAPDLLAYAEQTVAVVSVRGGAGSHAAIVARSLGLPFVSGLPSAALGVGDGVTVLVDGDTGTVVVSPGRAAVARVAARSAPVDAEAVAARRRPVRTRDEVAVTLLANVASSAEARRALDAGATGVGLLRTELPFLDAGAWPTAAEHESVLRPVLEVLRDRPVTVRLLDFTNDKTPPFLAGRVGATSLELLLDHAEALDAQLAAVLRAGRGTDLQVMLPMVTRPEEVTQVRDHLTRAAGQVGCPVPRLGAMLELPAAIDGLASLVEVTDFFSVGTNDLTAAVLGLARTDPRLSPARTAHPEVMGRVARAARLCAEAGRPLSVCGDAAADPEVLPLLLDAGVTVVSVAPSRLDTVRALVRAHGGPGSRDLVGSAVGSDA